MLRWLPRLSSARRAASEWTKGPAPPPPPAWRNWLIVIGALATVLLLFGPLMSTGPSVTTLTYTQFYNDVVSNRVATASIDPNGSVTGTLRGGQHYQSQIPTALGDTSLSPVLRQHGVQINGKTAVVGRGAVSHPQLRPVPAVHRHLCLSRSPCRTADGRGAREHHGVPGTCLRRGEADHPLRRCRGVRGREARGDRGGRLPEEPDEVLEDRRSGSLSVTGSGFVELFVGVGASRVRDLFAEARKRAPSIIFIDEIDGIGQRRGSAIVSNDEREQTLNQLLAEMDGFDPASSVVVMAATNRPEILDPALLRPGRFDRQVEIPLPNLKERAAVLAVHASGKRLESHVNLDVVARRTPGFSGADLANLVNEAAIVAVRVGRDRIRAKDFDEARDRILLGRREATNALLPEEKHAVAVHEAGHALVAVLSEHADPVAKVTILPAGQALGVTEQLRVDERHLYSESYLMDSLAIRMGGRAAEQLVMGEGSTGASNDLAGATQLATRMIREFGLSAKLGPIGFASGSPAYLGDQPVRTREYAEATQQVIDEEVERLLKEAAERASGLLQTHREALDRVVKLLLERETIEGADVEAAVRASAPTVSVAEPRQPALTHAANPAKGLN